MCETVWDSEQARRNILPCLESNHGRPARSRSLYGDALAHPIREERRTFEVLIILNKEL